MTKKRKVLAALIAVGMLIILYSIFLWNVAKSDFESLTEMPTEYSVKVFSNYGSENQALLPGQPVTEEISVSNTGGFDAYARLYLQSVFDVTYSDSVKPIALSQNAATVPVGLITHEFVRRNEDNGKWENARFEVGGATHLRVTYDPDGKDEADYSDPDTCNNIILYIAFGDYAAEHWSYVSTDISGEEQLGSRFGWFVLKDTLHSEEVAPLLIKTITLGEEVIPYYSDLVCDMDYKLESMQAVDGMNNLYLSE